MVMSMMPAKSSFTKVLHPRGILCFLPLKGRDMVLSEVLTESRPSCKRFPCQRVSFQCSDR